MKALFFHADQFGFEVVSPSERIGGSAPQEVKDASVRIGECLVALFHVEEGDTDRHIRRLCKDIRRIADQLHAKRLVVAAFGHLSHSYAPPEVAIRVSEQVLAVCREWEYEVYTSPFGHNKTFVLHSKGHPDAVKHRSY